MATGTVQVNVEVKLDKNFKESLDLVKKIFSDLAKAKLAMDRARRSLQRLHEIARPHYKLREEGEK